MVVRDDVRDLVMRAETHVRNALEHWEAANPHISAECCELLRMAVTDLAEAQQATEQGRVANDESMQKGLGQLRANVNLMARLVDASAAFCRGMALHIGAGDSDAGESETVAPSARGDQA